jgi:hypothetical protein
MNDSIRGPTRRRAWQLPYFANIFSWPGGCGRQRPLRRTSLRKIGLADWPLSGNREGRYGHEPEVESFKFAAELLPLSSDAG